MTFTMSLIGPEFALASSKETLRPKETLGSRFAEELKARLAGDTLFPGKKLSCISTKRGEVTFYSVAQTESAWERIKDGSLALEEIFYKDELAMGPSESEKRWLKRIKRWKKQKNTDLKMLFDTPGTITIVTVNEKEDIIANVVFVSADPRHFNADNWKARRLKLWKRHGFDPRPNDAFVQTWAILKGYRGFKRGNVARELRRVAIDEARIQGHKTVSSIVESRMFKNWQQYARAQGYEVIEVRSIEPDGVTFDKPQCFFRMDIEREKGSRFADAPKPPTRFIEKSILGIRDAGQLSELPDAQAARFSEDPGDFVWTLARVGDAIFLQKRIKAVGFSDEITQELTSRVKERFYSSPFGRHSYRLRVKYEQKVPPSISVVDDTVEFSTSKTASDNIIQAFDETLTTEENVFDEKYKDKGQEITRRGFWRAAMGGTIGLTNTAFIARAIWRSGQDKEVAVEDDEVPAVPSQPYKRSVEDLLSEAITKNSSPLNNFESQLLSVQLHNISITGGEEKKRIDYLTSLLKQGRLSFMRTDNIAGFKRVLREDVTGRRYTAMSETHSDATTVVIGKGNRMIHCVVFDKDLFEDETPGVPGLLAATAHELLGHVYMHITEGLAKNEDEDEKRAFTISLKFLRDFVESQREFAKTDKQMADLLLYIEQVTIPIEEDFLKNFTSGSRFAELGEGARKLDAMLETSEGFERAVRNGSLGALLSNWRDEKLPEWNRDIKDQAQYVTPQKVEPDFERHEYTVGEHIFAAVRHSNRFFPQFCPGVAAIRHRRIGLFHDVGKRGHEDFFGDHAAYSDRFSRKMMRELGYTNEIIDADCKVILYHNALDWLIYQTTFAPYLDLEEFAEFLTPENVNLMLALKITDLAAKKRIGYDEFMQRSQKERATYTRGADILARIVESTEDTSARVAAMKKEFFKPKKFGITQEPSTISGVIEKGEKKSAVVQGQAVISEEKQVAPGLSTRDITFANTKKAKTRRKVTGRAVIFNLREFLVRFWSNEPARKLDYIKFGLSQGIVDEFNEKHADEIKAGTRPKMTARARPGKTLAGIVADLGKKYGRPLCASNGNSPGWTLANGFLIADGKLIAKDVCGARQNEYEPLDGEYTVFCFDADKVGLRTVTIRNGKLINKENIQMAISALPILVDEGDKEPRMVFPKQSINEDGEVVSPKGDEAFFDAVTENAAFSAIGINEEGEVVLVHMMGEPGREIFLGEMAYIMHELGCKNACILGGSADVQQYVLTDGEVPKYEAEERVKDTAREGGAKVRKLPYAFSIWPKERTDIPALTLDYTDSADEDKAPAVSRFTELRKNIKKYLRIAMVATVMFVGFVLYIIRSDRILNTQPYSPTTLPLATSVESPGIRMPSEELLKCRDIVDSSFLNGQIRFLDSQVVKNSSRDGLYNGMLASYNLSEPAEKDPLYDKWRYLVKVGRAWPYDTAVGIYADLFNGRNEEAKAKVKALVRIMQEEDKQGFKEIIHFSYNTIESDFVQARAPMGATAWVLKAIFAYSSITGDRQFIPYVEEKLQYVLNQQVIKANGYEENDVRYGLFKSNFNGWKREVVVTEHNADAHDLLNLAYRLTGKAIYKERKDILLTSLVTRLWDDRGFFYMFLDPYLPIAGKVTDRKAIDCSSWMGSVLLSNGYIDQARKAIEFIEGNFIVEDEGITGTKFYAGKSGILRSFCLDYDAVENLFIQPEATAGYLHLLFQFAQVTPNPQEREWALDKIKFYLESLKKLHKRSSAGGLLYATKNVGEDFSTMDSAVASATLATFLGELKNPKLSWLFIGIPEKPIETVSSASRFTEITPERVQFGKEYDIPQLGQVIFTDNSSFKIEAVGPMFSVLGVKNRGVYTLTWNEDEDEYTWFYNGEDNPLTNISVTQHTAGRYIKSKFRLPKDDGVSPIQKMPTRFTEGSRNKFWRSPSIIGLLTSLQSLIGCGIIKPPPPPARLVINIAPDFTDELNKVRDLLRTGQASEAARRLKELALNEQRAGKYLSYHENSMALEILWELTWKERQKLVMALFEAGGITHACAYDTLNQVRDAVSYLLHLMSSVRHSYEDRDRRLVERGTFEEFTKKYGIDTSLIADLETKTSLTKEDFVKQVARRTDFTLALLLSNQESLGMLRQVAPPRGAPVPKRTLNPRASLKLAGINLHDLNRGLVDFGLAKVTADELLSEGEWSTKQRLTKEVATLDIYAKRDIEFFLLRQKVKMAMEFQKRGVKLPAQNALDKLAIASLIIHETAVGNRLPHGVRDDMILMHRKFQQKCWEFSRAKISFYSDNLTQAVVRLAGSETRRAVAKSLLMNFVSRTSEGDIGRYNMEFGHLVQYFGLLLRYAAIDATFEGINKVKDPDKKADLIPAVFRVSYRRDKIANVEITNRLFEMYQKETGKVKTAILDILAWRVSRGLQNEQHCFNLFQDHVQLNPNSPLYTVSMKFLAAAIGRSDTEVGLAKFREMAEVVSNNPSFSETQFLDEHFEPIESVVMATRRSPRMRKEVLPLLERLATDERFSAERRAYAKRCADGVRGLVDGTAKMPTERKPKQQDEETSPSKTVTKRGIKIILVDEAYEKGVPEEALEEVATAINSYNRWLSEEYRINKIVICGQAGDTNVYFRRKRPVVYMLGEVFQRARTENVIQMGYGAFVKEKDATDAACHETSHAIFNERRSEKRLGLWNDIFGYGEDIPKKNPNVISPFELVDDSNYESTGDHNGHPEEDSDEFAASSIRAFTRNPDLLANYIENAPDKESMQLGVLVWVTLRDHWFKGNVFTSNGIDPFEAVSAKYVLFDLATQAPSRFSEDFDFENDFIWDFNPESPEGFPAEGLVREKEIRKGVRLIHLGGDHIGGRITRSFNKNDTDVLIIPRPPDPNVLALSPFAYKLWVKDDGSAAFMRYAFTGIDALGEEHPVSFGDIFSVGSSPQLELSYYLGGPDILYGRHFSFIISKKADGEYQLYVEDHKTPMGTQVEFKACTQEEPPATPESQQSRFTEKKDVQAPLQKWREAEEFLKGLLDRDKTRWNQRERKCLVEVFKEAADEWLPQQLNEDFRRMQMQAELNSSNPAIALEKRLNLGTQISTIRQEEEAIENIIKDIFRVLRKFYVKKRIPKEIKTLICVVIMKALEARQWGMFQGEICPMLKEIKISRTNAKELVSRFEFVLNAMREEGLVITYTNMIIATLEAINPSDVSEITPALVANLEVAREAYRERNLGSRQTVVKIMAYLYEQDREAFETEYAKLEPDAHSVIIGDLRREFSLHGQTKRLPASSSDQSISTPTIYALPGAPIDASAPVQLKEKTKNTTTAARFSEGMFIPWVSREVAVRITQAAIEEHLDIAREVDVYGVEIHYFDRENHQWIEETIYDIHDNTLSETDQINETMFEGFEDEGNHFRWSILHTNSEPVIMIVVVDAMTDLTETETEGSAYIEQLCTEGDADYRVCKFLEFNGMPTAPVDRSTIMRPQQTPRTQEETAQQPSLDTDEIEATIAKLSNPKEDDGAIEQLLIIGSSAENLIIQHGLFYMDSSTHKNTAVAVASCNILAEVGTEKAVPALDVLSRSKVAQLAEAAKTAIDEIREREVAGTITDKDGDTHIYRLSPRVAGGICTGRFTAVITKLEDTRKPEDRVNIKIFTSPKTIARYIANILEIDRSELEEEITRECAALLRRLEDEGSARFSESKSESDLAEARERAAELVEELRGDWMAGPEGRRRYVRELTELVQRHPEAILTTEEARTLLSVIRFAGDGQEDIQGGLAAILSMTLDRDPSINLNSDTVVDVAWKVKGLTAQGQLQGLLAKIDGDLSVPMPEIDMAPASPVPSAGKSLTDVASDFAAFFEGDLPLPYMVEGCKVIDLGHPAVQTFMKRHNIILIELSSNVLTRPTTTEVLERAAGLYYNPNLEFIISSSGKLYVSKELPDEKTAGKEREAIRKRGFALPVVIKGTGRYLITEFMLDYVDYGLMGRYVSYGLLQKVDAMHEKLCDIWVRTGIVVDDSQGNFMVSVTSDEEIDFIPIDFGETHREPTRFTESSLAKLKFNQLRQRKGLEEWDRTYRASSKVRFRNPAVFINMTSNESINGVFDDSHFLEKIGKKRNIAIQDRPISSLEDTAGEVSQVISELLSYKEQNVCIFLGVISEDVQLELQSLIESLSPQLKASNIRLKVIFGQPSTSKERIISYIQAANEWIANNRLRPHQVLISISPIHMPMNMQEELSLAIESLILLEKETGA